MRKSSARPVSVPSLPRKRRLTSTASWAAVALAVSLLSGGVATPVLATTPADYPPLKAPPFVINPLTGKKETVVQSSPLPDPLTSTPATPPETAPVVLTEKGNQILQVTNVGQTFQLLGSDDVYEITETITDADNKITAVKARNQTTNVVETIDRVTRLIGPKVTNPESGLDETVVKVMSLSMVLTDKGNAILLPNKKDDLVYQVDGKGNVTKIFKILTVDTTPGYVDKVSLENINDSSDKPPAAKTVYLSNDAGPTTTDGAGGSGSKLDVPVPPGGDLYFAESGTGQTGSDGDDGGGFEICFGILGCIRIAWDPTPGGEGAPGPDWDETINAARIAPNTQLHTASDGKPGILLSSIGGTGGQGGDAYGNIDAAPGGKAGVGGEIILHNSVDITTTGKESHGIFVKSSAGQGGEGGKGYIASTGGTGGSAAEAGTVYVENHGRIVTGGDGAIGIQAQSLGGKAGNGGASYGIVGEGGGGSTGGNGSTVTVRNYGEILTAKDFSHGILAQSIGGSGGNGGESGGLVAFPDKGGAGGNGGNVDVTNAGRIETFGKSARGIFAESIGGGGGTGGDSAGLAAIGGTGGAGSYGGTVTVTNSGSVITHGEKSIAIFAQSVGGGGGDGGSSSGPLLSVGGDGESGGDGAKVVVTNTGLISTAGDDAHGIFAQSVGGGGGNGGSSDSTSAFGGIALGGKGGKGGLGGEVDITFDGKTGEGVIQTQGDRSRGIFAQSVGGGGGAGGVAKQFSGGLGAAVSLAIGGRGGDGGKGGVVNVGDVGACKIAVTCYTQVQNDLYIQTRGDNAEGVYVQSVGGGGGGGGYAIAVAASAGLGGSASISTAVGGSGGKGGAGGDVTVRTGGTIQTGSFGGAFVMKDGKETSEVRNNGQFSTGLLAQSVGGGGGKGGFSISTAAAASGGASFTLAGGVGGDGGDGGNAGTVDADFNGSITTLGDDAAGAIIQSVGGGGGTGGYNISASIAVGGVAGAAGSVGVGGSGGTAGAGATALGTIGGDVLTVGDRSTGVIVQSVGGGGGNGGFNISGSIGAGGAGGGGIAIGVGGKGGGGGAGGRAEGTTLGQITTLGDDAGGLLVQSVGGGGGNGGFNVSGAIGAGGVAGGGISVGLGGNAGTGNSGGFVTGDARGEVQTSGDRSTGVTVQSLGGGGGNGGFSVAGAIGAGGTVGGGISLAIGGSGGLGGTGGEVHGTAGTITTFGNESGGFLAQSVGGGGGNGGFAVAGSIGAGGTAGGGISLSIGGSGASGGNAGFTDGKVTGSVTTTGRNATGVTVQSLGGGGGNGGFSVAGAIGAGGTAGGGISVGLGGSGGKAGDGGAVLASAKSISTSNDFSGGFLAQSVGGGGGNGGFSVAGSIGAGGTGGAGISVGIGGSAGGGGASKRVDATVDGDVFTSGTQSDAIVAQSLGGGGGNGGFAIAGSIGAGGTGAGAVSVGIGGSGGKGGNSGTVNLTVTGLTETRGADSNGIIAQSIGGGGGNGGFSIAGNIAASGKGAGSVGVAIGGSGGDGGNAGNDITDKVTLNVTGVADPSGGGPVAVVTHGAGSRAVLAQSVGGGGGNGGFSIAGSVSLASDAAGNIGVGIGGSGGKGGLARDVEGNVTGDVLTFGASDAAGVLVQSIGGGGGNGGFNITGGLSASTKAAGNLLVGVGGMGGDGGVSGAVRGTVTGNVFTYGSNSGGVTYQSLAGGGGNGGFNITGGVALTSSNSGGAGNLGVGVGGFGGKGSDARLVDATILGNISTAGEKSYGALLQSVGGGGGNGGFNITGSFEASSGKGGSIGIGVGGFGGGGGASGTVTGVLSGDVYTVGDDAYGAMLQSLGGGGGNGGFNITGGAALTSGDNAALGVGIGGFGGDGGHADTVRGTLTGNYTTQGARSGGVIVQSLGGGGGNGGLNITGELNLSAKGKSAQASVGVGGFGGDGGYAGEAWLTRTGDTRTSGADSQAILVQSVGGGGGNGGINVSGGLVAAKGDDASINLGLGGFGGDASYAQAVHATILGNVSATGLRADTSNSPLFTGAVVAQSVGGGGGTGGLNVSGGVSLTKSGGSGKVASIGIGGFAGGGGDAGTVDLILGAPSASRVSVIASGDNRAGIVAQSLGGGGGIGGLNISGGVSTNSALAFGIGGFGGDGGLARKVTAGIDADIATFGDGTRGILAQSLGGGGGAGGINISGTVDIKSQDDKSITFGLGGSGGAGNISGAVDVTQNGVVLITGANGIGVMAQSVAGGGGDGGINAAFNITNASANKNTKRAIFGIGGEAGAGADAGDVTVNSTGLILVDGPASTATADDPNEARTIVFNAGGVLAQSIGGGGGLGGMNVSLSAARNAGDTLQFGMGGSGGAGGDAGNVTVIRGYDALTGTADASAIVTVGDYASGLVAQSVGGGGGMGGMNLNFAYNKESKAEEDSKDNKNYTAAVISVGGDGADAGDGKVVTVRHDGQIGTDGVYSHGIVAQSIGGGGGASNVNLGGSKLGDKTTTLNIGVGGANGAAGKGDLVDVDQVGAIFTEGAGSMGIKAQSVGGGGGSTNGFNQYLDPAIDALVGHLDGSTTSVNIGRQGGSGGEGGEVRVKADGFIVTGGADAIGIMAQSVGGGGGTSGTTTVGGDFTFESAGYGGSLAIGLDGGKAATGGVVTVTAKGQVQTFGDRAHAIFAQSLGGGGGMGGTVGDKLTINKGEDEDTTTSASVSVGGKGGDGSFARQVTVGNAADLFTVGDQASGIWAQSIGGSGGAGGDYLQSEIQNVKAGKTSRSFALNIGGTGGTGALGGGVTVANTGHIQTLGVQSFGIRAESVGGGGGDGGAVSKGTLQTGSGSKQSVDINVGGHGGDGGKGGVVGVINEGTILTADMGAEGIRATSTGGGGGNAGVIINTLVTATGAAAQTQTVAMNFGGDGGTGGEGGNVTVDNRQTAAENSGIIWTQGDSAHGIFAQSLGGGGGNGSSVITMTGLKSTKDSFAVGLNFGGNGGSGNIAGAVKVSNSGQIATDGNNAYGILAQSTGGGGGNGGLVLTAAAAVSQNASTPVLSIGGKGGDGGNGGAVEVDNTGLIYTSGAGSHGIVAQSIGGGGGNAGVGIALTNDATSFAISNTLSLIAGATGGGKGGAGGEVKVTQAGDVSVLGEGAQAVVAESINGGGGHLDFDLSGVVGMPGFSFKSVFADAFGLKPADTVTDPKIATRLGGVDLKDMNAGKVTVVSTGRFGVGGDNGVGSFTQSLGGGGGTLHLKTEQAAATADGGSAAIAYSVDLGGANGVNNSGADLEGTRTGFIVTSGVNALGVLSQSIGGGGGQATLDITTETGGLVGPVTLSFGSRNGTTETGGKILRSESGAVTTTADLSSATMVQSIGGGGGAASVVLHTDRAGLAATSGVATDTGPIKARSSAPAPAPVTLSFGAAGGSGLNGGTVTNSYSGGAFTTGDHALGLFVQSVGAGGGVATVSGDSAANVTLGGSLSASGNGGALTITSSGDIETEGAGSHGVVLQSIGGGGGAVFGAGAGSSVALNGGNTGNGGAIRFDQTGDVRVTGAGASGVVAQSLGGGGGWIDNLFAGTAGGSGKGGAITLNLNGSAVATGTGATAVLAQSLGSLGGGDIVVNATGEIRGNVAGIRIDGGAANTVTTSGLVSAVSGLAISGTDGNDAVINTGLVIGNVDLGKGANSFSNRAGATFVAYSTINLFDPPPVSVPAGPASAFTNAGDFQMGLAAPRRPIDLLNGAVFDNFDADGDPETNPLLGARVINAVTLDGNFVQTASGHMAFDVAFGPYASDKVTLSGSAQVAGTGTVILTALGNATPVTLFAAAKGGVDNGLKIDDTLAMDYRIEAGTQGIQLAYTSHFGQPFLNRNGVALGHHMDSALTVGGSDGIGRTMALIGNLRSGEEYIYSALFDELNPEPFVTGLIAQDAAADRFSRDLFGCTTVTAPGQNTCVWGHIEGNTLNRIPDFDGFRASGQGQSLSTGFERPLNDLWSLTVAVGYDRINALNAGNGRARSDGQSLDLGVGLRRTLSTGADLALSLSSGWQELDTKRRVNVFEPLVGTSSPRTTFLRAAMQFGKTYRYGHIFTRPMLNLSATTLHQVAFNEQGLEGIGIAGQDHTQFITAAGPEFAFGYVSAEDSDYTAKLELNAGRSYRDARRVTMAYRFLGDNPLSDPALISTFIGRYSDHLGADLDVARTDGRMSMRFSYKSAQGGKRHDNSVGMSVKAKF